jgi:hypothetical protein
MSEIKVSVSVSGSIPRPHFASALLRAKESSGRAGVRAGRATLGIHRRTGATSQGLRFRIRPDEVEWYDGTPQALFLEEGTKRHIIKPRNKKVLYWPEARGGPVFAGRVNHPGTKPYHWLGEGIHRSVPLFVRFFEERVREELDG